jgi:HEAT repeat protein
VAIAALAGLVRRRPDPIARELLCSLAEGSDAVVAAEAIDALGAMRDPLAAPRLSRLLGKGDATLRRRVVQALGELGDQVDAALLIARLDEDASPSVRAEAAWALGKRAASPAVEAALGRGLASREAAVRANAAGALARLGRAPDALRRLVGDDDPAVRANAALALPRSAASLARLEADDPDPRVRAAAHRARGGNGPGARGDWIGLYLVDFDGAPLAEACYRLVLPDGLIKSGLADARGIVREESVPPGACDLELVDEPTAR